MLAESGSLPLSAIAAESQYNVVDGIAEKNPRIRILYDHVFGTIRLLQEHKNHLFLYSLEISNESFLLAGIHFPSKLYQSREAQLCEAIDYMEQIRKAERDFSNGNTIVIGDFNMNPFDSGMISGKGFNSVCSREIAARIDRRIQQTSYSYFYNPCWRLYGNDDSERYGTYFRPYPGHDGFHWNIYDQALIRPQVMAEYDIRFAAIDNELFFSHRKKACSDHAPIKLSLSRRL